MSLVDCYRVWKRILNPFALDMLIKKINILPFSFAFFVLILSGINISCGGQQGKEIQPKTNLPPAITSISISPDRPNQESELSLFVQSQDPDGDSVTFRYQWIKNEEEIPGENGDTLKNVNFKKRDFIQVKVVPSDGKADGDAFLSGPVKIFNMPPVVEEARIEPKLAYANSELKAVVKGSDPDGDPIHYLYQWEKNGISISEEATGIFNSKRFRRGDSIAVTVIPNDGETSGKPKKSDPITIANSPPIIVSSPPTKLDGNIYIYQVKANDPDDDPVVFTLKTAPKGMTINEETGLIQWEVLREYQGSHLIEIEVSDSGGAKSFQRYTLTIAFR